MKHYLLYTIPHNVLLLAVGLLLGVVPVYATSAKTDAPTCGDYDYTVTAVRGGTITAVFDTAS